MCRGSVELPQPGAAPRAASGKQWDFIPPDRGCCITSRGKALARVSVCLSELPADGNATVLTHSLGLSFSHDPSVSGECVGLFSPAKLLPPGHKRLSKPHPVRCSTSSAASATALSYKSSGRAPRTSSVCQGSGTPACCHSACVSSVRHVLNV